VSGDVREAVSDALRYWEPAYLFLIGMAVAAIITRWFAIAFFAPSRAG